MSTRVIQTVVDRVYRQLGDRVVVRQQVGPVVVIGTLLVVIRLETAEGQVAVVRQLKADVRGVAVSVLIGQRIADAVGGVDGRGQRRRAGYACAGEAEVAVEGRRRDGEIDGAEYQLGAGLGVDVGRYARGQQHPLRVIRVNQIVG